MSQIGARIPGRSTEERDIDAVLAGTSGRNALRASLTSLNAREQVLLVGRAVPMLTVIQARKYDDEFYHAVGTKERSVTQDWADLNGP